MSSIQKENRLKTLKTHVVQRDSPNNSPKVYSQFAKSPKSRFLKLKGQNVINLFNKSAMESTLRVSNLVKV